MKIGGKATGVTGEQRVVDVLDCCEVKCSSGKEVTFETTLKANEVRFYQVAPPPVLKLIPLAPKEVTPPEPLRPTKRKPQPWQLPADVPKLDAGRREGKIAVGISGDKELADALYEGLRQQASLVVTKVAGVDLRAEMLSHLDVAILCNEGPEQGALTWFEDMREFVINGGGVLLTHFAIGGGAYPPQLFPEIGRDRGKVVSTTIIPVGDHPIVAGYTKDERYKHMYWDHVVIEPGVAACPLFKDEAGNVVAVAGMVGKGRVVATGFCFEIDGTPTSSQPTAPTGSNLQLLLQILEWLARSARR